jgi:RimJ/RimL family protein N-acetyltransferase
MGALIAGHVYRQLKLKGRVLILRAMRWDDTDRLLSFINALADEKQKGKGSEIFTGFEERLSRNEEAAWVAGQMVKLENRGMVGVLAEVAGQVVGVGQITKGHYKETDHHGELGLTVLGSHRGLGIGKQMIKILLREAKKIGVKNVEVEFLATNQAAAHAYQRAGFSEVGRIPGKVQRNRKLLDSMIMSRKL